MVSISSENHGFPQLLLARHKYNRYKHVSISSENHGFPQRVRGLRCGHEDACFNLIREPRLPSTASAASSCSLADCRFNLIREPRLPSTMSAYVAIVQLSLVSISSENH